jgi:peptidylprolyl isomerase
MKLRNLLVLIITVLFMSNVSIAKEAEKEKSGKANPENTIYMQLTGGRVVIELLPESAPMHVARIKELARENFYDGVVFHRVIDGFMAQTGDPTGTGMGGSSKADLKAEFNDIPHDRGVVSMARSANPDSANSQFFVVLEDSHFLDHQYTVWGRVVEGMEFVDAIKKGDARQNGKVNNPDKIITMRVAADVKEEKKEESKGH